MSQRVTFEDKRLPGFSKAAFTLYSELAPEWSAASEAVNSKMAAVMFLLFWDLDQSALYAVLTKRSTKLPTHKGQISFAGGHKDVNDLSPEETALREVNEEIGIDSKKIKILGRLSTRLAIDNKLVVPIVGFYEGKFIDFIPALGEIQTMIFFPVEEILANKKQTFKFNLFGVLRESYLFVFDGEKVWGLTAEIIVDADLSL